MIIHTGLQTTLTIPGHGIGGHGDDREIGELRELANRLRGLDAVHDRHLHIHEHQIVLSLLYLLERDRPILGEVHQQAGAGQQLHRHLLVQLVVLDDQQARPADAFELRQLRVRSRGGVARTADLPAEDIHRGVEQDRGVDRLDQNIGDPGRSGVRDQLLFAVGGHHHQFRLRIEPERMDSPSNLQSVHTRHPPVEIDQGERPTFPSGTVDRIDRGRTGIRLGHLERHAREHVAQDCPGVVVIVDDECRTVGEIGTRHQQARFGAADPEHNSEPEGAALARRAVDMDLSTHQLDETPGDRQT